MAVVKLRSSAHCDEIRQYEIIDGDIVIGSPVGDYEGILGGQPTQAAAQCLIK
jgi:circadian clock protein KaiC